MIPKICHASQVTVKATSVMGMTCLVTITRCLAKLAVKFTYKWCPERRLSWWYHWGWSLIGQSLNTIHDENQKLQKFTQS